MSQEGHLNIVSLGSSSIEATIAFGPTQVKECGIFLLSLLKVRGFVRRCSFKQNTQGVIRFKLVLRKREGWRQELNAMTDSVASLTMKTKNLNGD